MAPRISLGGIPSIEVFRTALGWMRSAQKSIFGQSDLRVNVHHYTLDSFPDSERYLDVELLIGIPAYWIRVDTNHFDEEQEVSVCYYQRGDDGSFASDPLGHFRGKGADAWESLAAAAVSSMHLYECYPFQNQVAPRNWMEMERIIALAKSFPGTKSPIVGLELPEGEPEQYDNVYVTFSGEESFTEDAFAQGIEWARRLTGSFLVGHAMFEVEVTGPWTIGNRRASHVYSVASCPGNLELRLHWCERKETLTTPTAKLFRKEEPIRHIGRAMLNNPGDWESASRRLITEQGDYFLDPLKRECRRLAALIEAAGAKNTTTQN